jgi:outer membrane lipoprotein SlyB
MTTYPTTTRPHPLVLIAAASVTLLCATGIAAIGGWLPSPIASATTTDNTPASTAIARSEPVKSPAPTAQTVVRKSVPPVAATNAPADFSKATTRVGDGMTAVVAPISENRAHVDLIPTSPSMPNNPVTEARPHNVASSPACLDCGVIEAINEIQTPASGTGGAVVGGVIGGILGNQIGTGTTRNIATAIGIAGGAMAGRQIEKANISNTRYDTVVTLEDGSRRTFSSESRPAWRHGEKVRIQNGELIARP